MDEKMYKLALSLSTVMDVIKTYYIEDVMLTIWIYNIIEDLELPIDICLNKYINMDDRINNSIYYSSISFLSMVYKKNIPAAARFNNRIYRTLSDTINNIINKDKKEVITLENIIIKKTELHLVIKAV